MIAVVLLCANETTQLLKPLLAGPRDEIHWVPIGTASWPSGQPPRRCRWRCAQ